MYIFTRYVVAEVLKQFLLMLLGLTLVVTTAMAVKEGMNRGLPLWLMFITIPYMLPEMMTISIPVSLLWAVSSVYGRITGFNELVALKSLGINPLDIIAPTLILSFLLSLCTVYTQELAATWGRPNIQRILAREIVEIAYSVLPTTHSYKLADSFSIAVQRVEGRKLIRPTIKITASATRPRVEVRALEAELSVNYKDNTLRFVCEGSDVDIGGISGYFPEPYEVAVPMNMPDRPDYHRDWVAMYEVPELIKRLQAKVDEIEGIRLQHLTNNAPLPEEKVKELDYNQWLIHRLETEPYRRLSNGFTCLCFVLIGVPVAMLWRHADVLTNFFVCFLPILAIYYPLLMLGEDLSTKGVLPPIFFWTGNVVLIVPGLYLIRYIIRH